MGSKISKFALVKNTTLEGGNAIGKLTKVEDSHLGYGSYISSYSKIFK